ncbi:hypothetical protein KQH81_07025 [Clostridium cadaveris]|uniref:J domain-containing protein n=1 Tax=Clostridium cadaveris TaxID=1529 RepID=A0A316M102_9CLOT|nr:hypothetical protein [Clostridium cadaveris]PWL52076.1 MAG: hypothetical protein DBY38_12205 [Clostridium cadaveris]UFH65061.1 hypothetical protein KQH81_00345 [Clostridium cadaveris]UFH66265.1 hypothetical protein KQH81_07025 [Clostridium cadaveris]
MYCVIQEIKVKKANSYGASKELKVSELKWFSDGVEHCKYEYTYSDERFERPIKKAYKISIHQSYRENGKVKKKQWSLCTMNYYDIIEFSLYDYAGNKIKALSEELKLTEDEIYNMVWSKLDPLTEQIEKEFQETEEYKVSQQHRAIIDKYLQAKRDFEDIYGNDTYDYCYDVFGELRNKEMLDNIKRQYEASKDYQRSYYESYQSNYNYDSYSGYQESIHSNYTDEEKKKLKQIYKTLALKFHPDVCKDDGNMMKLVNKLKEEWGI